MGFPGETSDFRVGLDGVSVGVSTVRGAIRRRVPRGSSWGARASGGVCRINGGGVMGWCVEARGTEHFSRNEAQMIHHPPRSRRDVVNSFQVGERCLSSTSCAAGREGC